jgi:hypothetical protein
MRRESGADAVGRRGKPCPRIFRTSATDARPPASPRATDGRPCVGRRRARRLPTGDRLRSPETPGQGPLATDFRRGSLSCPRSPVQVQLSRWSPPLPKKKTAPAPPFRCSTRAISPSRRWHEGVTKSAGWGPSSDRRTRERVGEVRSLCVSADHPDLTSTGRISRIHASIPSENKATAGY